MQRKLAPILLGAGVLLGPGLAASNEIPDQLRLDGQDWTSSSRLRGSEAVPEVLGALDYFETLLATSEEPAKSAQRQSIRTQPPHRSCGARIRSPEPEVYGDPTRDEVIGQAKVVVSGEVVATRVGLLEDGTIATIVKLAVRERWPEGAPGTAHQLVVLHEGRLELPNGVVCSVGNSRREVAPTAGIRMLLMSSHGYHASNVLVADRHDAELIFSDPDGESPSTAFAVPTTGTENVFGAVPAQDPNFDELAKEIFETVRSGS